MDGLFWLPLPSHRSDGVVFLHVVPQADVTSIDPIRASAQHGFMVYDTLYGLDACSRNAIREATQRVAINIVAYIPPGTCRSLTATPEGSGQRIGGFPETEKNVTSRNMSTKLYGVSPRGGARCMGMAYDGK